MKIHFLPMRLVCSFTIVDKSLNSVYINRQLFKGNSNLINKTNLS